MSDLVRELREWSDGPGTDKLCRRAADRIEADEALLRQALEVLKSTIEDSAELLNERKLAWAGYREHKLSLWEAELERHRAVELALRERLGDK